jgi:hypothetical protein
MVVIVVMMIVVVASHRLRIGAIFGLCRGVSCEPDTRDLIAISRRAFLARRKPRFRGR